VGAPRTTHGPARGALARLRFARPRARVFDDGEIGYRAHVVSDEYRPVNELSIRELVAELARVEDRLRDQAHHAGPHPLPGQVSREAALRRRERALLAELRVRRSGPSAQTAAQGQGVAPVAADVHGSATQ
jgi:hypothetical protein